MPIPGLLSQDRMTFPKIGDIRKGAKKTDPKKPGPDLTYFRYVLIEGEEEAALAFVRETGIVEALKEMLQKTPLKETLDKQADGSFVYRDTGEVVGFVHMQEPEEERSFEVV